MLRDSIHKMMIFRHYKGKEYLFLGYCKHSETQEEMVVYQALYGDYEIWTRPRSMFYEDVIVDGRTVPRFASIIDTAF